jgi:hypothetical protein
MPIIVNNAIAIAAMSVITIPVAIALLSPLILSSMLPSCS